MSGRHPAGGRGGRAVAALAGALAVVATTAGPAWPQASAAGRPGQDDVEMRVRDLEIRVRDLTYRSSALDNSERVEEAPEETSVTFASDVLFEYDQDELTPEAEDRMADVAEQLAELGPRSVSIAGHTDSHGDTAYNQDLSLRRAEAVRAALAGSLGEGYTFDVAGQGESQPVAPNENDDGSDNPEGRALNRRVEITFPT